MTSATRFTWITFSHQSTGQQVAGERHPDDQHYQDKQKRMATGNEGAKEAEEGDGAGRAGPRW